VEKCKGVCEEWDWCVDMMYEGRERQREKVVERK
jgi:hypothetical protein